MPSDPLANLKTSATAAFFARILVHPLDNVRVSIQSSNVPNGVLPRLDHLLSIIRRELQYQQKWLRQQQQQQQTQQLYGQHSSSKLFGERVTIYRGLYRGVSFALVFQVPALACFLSTYDFTKNKIAQLANLHNFKSFKVYDSETHLISGMLAKGAGTIIWAPMQKVQSLATHPVLGQVPLTLKEAYHIGKNICLSEGVQGLWSGYTKSWSALLPYTMIYFATYEQLKQISRWIVSSSNPDEKGFQHGNTTGESLLDRLTLLRQYWSISELESQRIANTRLSLDTYMMCVASAVIISSTVCQTATSIRTTFWDHLESSQSMTPSNHDSPSPKNRVQLSRLAQVIRQQYQPSSIGSPVSPISPVSPTRALPSSLSVVAASRANTFKSPPFVSTSNSLTAAAQNLSGIPWKQRQHASLTTTSILPFQSTTMNHQHFRGVYSGPACTLPSPNNLFNTTTNANNPLIQQHYSPSGSQQLIKNYYNIMSNTKSSPVMNLPSLPLYDNEMRHASNSGLVTTANNANANVGLSQSNSSAVSNLTSSTSRPSPTSGLVRAIARGLGPRILWTVPGVTLTTAGFEFLRGFAAAP